MSLRGVTLTLRRFRRTVTPAMGALIGVIILRPAKRTASLVLGKKWGNGTLTLHILSLFKHPCIVRTCGLRRTHSAGDLRPVSRGISSSMLSAVFIDRSPSSLPAYFTAALVSRYLLT